MVFGTLEWGETIAGETVCRRPPFLHVLSHESIRGSLNPAMWQTRVLCVTLNGQIKEWVIKAVMSVTKSTALVT